MCDTYAYIQIYMHANIYTRMPVGSPERPTDRAWRNGVRREGLFCPPLLYPRSPMAAAPCFLLLIEHQEAPLHDGAKLQVTQNEKLDVSITIQLV